MASKQHLLRGMVAIAVVAASCTEENKVPPAWDGSGAQDGLTEAATPAGDSGTPLCLALAFLECKTSTQLLRCNAAGTATETVDCSPYLCDALHQRCTQCDPLMPPTCSGNDLLLCSPEGLLIRSSCPAGCAGGACVGCTPQTFWLDWDKDGYGDAKQQVSTCTQPAGYVTNDLDCDDLDPAAHPGQSAFFNVPTKGTKTFDYNCNQVEEREYPALASCALVGGNCTGDGWVATIPACGQLGDFARCNKQGGNPPGCETTTSNRNQGCH